MRVLVVSLAMFMAGCATAPPQIVGPYASRLSPSDIAEITAVTATHLSRLHIRATGPPWRITVTEPGQVTVDAPIADGESTTITFDVSKRNGHWVAPEGSVVVEG